MIAPSSVASHPHRAGPGRGRLQPGPAGVPARVFAGSATSTGSCSSPTRSSPGFGRTGRMWGFEHAGIVPDVVVLAKAIANGLPLSAIVLVARPAGALGHRRPRLDVRRQSGRLRGRAGRPGHDPRRSGSWRTRRPRRRAPGRPGADRGRGPTGSATSVAPGLMIGVEFVRDRATREPDGALPNG